MQHRRDRLRAQLSNQYQRHTNQAQSDEIESNQIPTEWHANYLAHLLHLVGVMAWNLRRDFLVVQLGWKRRNMLVDQDDQRVIDIGQMNYH